MGPLLLILPAIGLETESKCASQNGPTVQFEISHTLSQVPGTPGASTLPTTSGGGVTPTNGPASGPGGTTTGTSPAGGGITPSQGPTPSGTKPPVATTGQPGGGGGGKTNNSPSFGHLSSQ